MVRHQDDGHTCQFDILLKNTHVGLPQVLLQYALCTNSVVHSRQGTREIPSHEALSEHMKCRKLVRQIVGHHMQGWHLGEDFSCDVGVLPQQGPPTTTLHNKQFKRAAEIQKRPAAVCKASRAEGQE